MKRLLAAAAMVLLATTTAHADPLAEAFSGGWCLLVRDNGGLYVRGAYCIHIGPNNCEAVHLQAVVRRSSPAGFMCVRGCCFWAEDIG
jgi:hypothetical protein